MLRGWHPRRREGGQRDCLHLIWRETFVDKGTMVPVVMENAVWAVGEALEVDCDA